MLGRGKPHHLGIQAKIQTQMLSCRAELLRLRLLVELCKSRRELVDFEATHVEPHDMRSKLYSRPHLFETV
jgi:hypothetical protein